MDEGDGQNRRLTTHHPLGALREMAIGRPPNPLSRAQREWVKWSLDTSEDKPTEREMASFLGVTYDTITKWKRNPVVIAEHQRQLFRTRVLTPERLTVVLEKTMALAEEGERWAIQEILRLVGRSPAWAGKDIVELVNEDPQLNALADMSDEELQERIEQMRRAR